jgi:hypothetical protein
MLSVRKEVIPRRRMPMERHNLGVQGVPETLFTRFNGLGRSGSEDEMLVSELEKGSLRGDDIVGYVSEGMK